VGRGAQIDRHVTRDLQSGAWKKLKIVQRNGSVLLIRNMSALKAMVSS
jgi:hypothetical protein